jgi:F-type H+-transporting ATPase subunit b
MTRILRLVAQTLGLFALLFLVSSPAFAEEASSSPTDSPAGQFFHWLNFAIIFAFIVYALRKAAPALRARSDEISRKIAEGARAREAAEQQRRDAQAKLAGIDKEVAELRIEVKRASEAEAERIRALAKTDAENVERAAQAEIAAAERAARIELRQLAARLAVERAEAVLQQQLTPAAEATLFGSFVANLERSPN